MENVHSYGRTELVQLQFYSDRGGFHKGFYGGFLEDIAGDTACCHLKPSHVFWKLIYQNYIYRYALFFARSIDDKTEGQGQNIHLLLETKKYTRLILN